MGESTPLDAEILMKTYNKRKLSNFLLMPTESHKIKDNVASKQAEETVNPPNLDYGVHKKLW